MFQKLGTVYRISSSRNCGKEARQKSTPKRSQRWPNRLRQQLRFVKWTMRTVHRRMCMRIRYGTVTISIVSDETYFSVYNTWTR